MPKKKPETIPISDNLYTVAICAVRYALGRRTYMPGLVTDWVMANFAGRMPKGTAEIMLRDIQEQREMGERAKYDSLATRATCGHGKILKHGLRRKYANAHLQIRDIDASPWPRRCAEAGAATGEKRTPTRTIRA